MGRGMWFVRSRHCCTWYCKPWASARSGTSSRSTRNFASNHSSSPFRRFDTHPDCSGYPSSWPASDEDTIAAVIGRIVVVAGIEPADCIAERDA